METFTIVVSVIGFIISIIVLVKFFQIATDIRAIRQSIPLSYKVDLNDVRGSIADAELAAKMGNKEYARQILLLTKERMTVYSPKMFKTQIEQVDKILFEL